MTYKHKLWTKIFQILQEITELLSNLPDPIETILSHVRDMVVILGDAIDELANRRQGLADMKEL